MAEHYFQYTSWKKIQTGGRPSKGPYFYAASEQFGNKVKEGDVIWHCTLRPREGSTWGELILCGRLIAGCITRDEAKARQIIQERIGQDFIWKRKPDEETTHIFSREEDAKPYCELSIHDLAAYICSQNKSTENCLTITNSEIDPKQLETVRHLTIGTVRRLQERWESVSHDPL